MLDKIIDNPAILEPYTKLGLKVAEVTRLICEVEGN